MRRFLTSATLAAIGLSLTAPLAFAHDDTAVHRMAWGASPNPTTADDGQQVYANDEIVAASAEFIDGVSKWEVIIRPAAGGQPSTCAENIAQRNGKYPQRIYINCPWDTTRATRHILPNGQSTSATDAENPKFSRTWQSEDLGPSVNGRYTIEITAWSAGQPYPCGAIGLGTCNLQPDQIGPHALYQSGSNPPRWREVFVGNDVSAPGGVGSAFDQGNNRISVTWAANPEPDVSYEVQEKVGDGKFATVGTTPGPRYERTVDQPGKYQYQVRAIRPAPTKDNANATMKSGYVAASAVDVAQITPPSTAGAAAPNGADGAPAGGDPGAPAATDPNSPTPTTAGARGGAPGKGSTSRPSGTSARPTGTSSRPAGSTAHEPGENEGEGPDEGFSAELPYNTESGDPKFAEDDGLGEEAGPQTLAGGVVPKPRDTRQLLVFMASALTLFVFAMQLTVLLRKSRPVVAGAAATEQYSDDFDDWLGF
jgi:hypothetical protein